MSLETVLKIGKALRSADDSLKYFKYIESPKDKDRNFPLCLTIPVKEDFTFDWDNIKITPENERENLYFLKFKTSDSDGFVKYVFGDIFFGKKSKVSKNGNIETSDQGYYRLEDSTHSNPAFRPSSFNRGKNDFKEIIRSSKADKLIIKQFHESLEKDLKLIENILSYIPAVEYYFIQKNDISFKDFLKNETHLKELSIKRNFEKASAANLKKLDLPVKYEEFTEKHKRKLENYNNASIFLHFEFPEGKHWYQFDEDLSLINAKILSDFVDSTENGIVLKKTIYKTLCSGDKKNDIQFPLFKSENKYKSWVFKNEDIQNLFYAIDYTDKGKLIAGTDIKMIVLPLGENLKAKDYEDFAEKRDEVRILMKNNEAERSSELLFDFFSNEESNNLTSFDLIFCKKGGVNSPATDLIEISGIERSKLFQTKKRIENIAIEVQNERKRYLKTGKNLFPLGVTSSFRNILGNPQLDNKTGKISIKPNPKYQSHLLKILPLIYTDNYYQDEVLLPAFIQNVEYAIRAGDENFRFLLFDLKFLLKIQNAKNDKYMEIINSESYQIGLKLGKLAKPLKKKINSFEKSYVGLLTRRVSTRDECIIFLNEINEMLVRHGKTWGQMSAEINETLANLPIKDYDKEKFAFGFFEGYFKYEASDKKKDFITRLERILADYEGNNELEEPLEKLNNLLGQIKIEINI